MRRALWLALVAAGANGCLGSELDQALAERCAVPGEVCPDSPSKLVQPPRFSGVHEPCGMLTATFDGQWEQPAETVTREWLLCPGPSLSGCAPVTGETGPTFKLPPESAGKYPGLRVTASRGGRNTLHEVVSGEAIAAPSSIPGLVRLDGFERDLDALNAVRADPTFNDITVQTSVSSPGRGGTEGALQVTSMDGHLLIPNEGNTFSVRVAVKMVGSSGVARDLLVMSNGPTSAAISISGAEWLLRLDGQSAVLGPLAVGEWTLLQLAVRFDAPSTLSARAALAGGAPVQLSLSAATGPLTDTRFIGSTAANYLLDDLAVAASDAFIPDGSVVRLPPIAADPLPASAITLSGTDLVASLADASPEDETHLEKVSGTAASATGIRFAAPSRGGTGARVVWNPKWTGATDSGASVTLKRGPIDYVMFEEGAPAPWVSHTLPPATEPTICAIEQTTASWGNNAVAGARLYSIWLELNLPN